MTDVSLIVNEVFNDIKKLIEKLNENAVSHEELKGEIKLLNQKLDNCSSNKSQFIDSEISNIKDFLDKLDGLVDKYGDSIKTHDIDIDTIFKELGEISEFKDENFKLSQEITELGQEIGGWIKFINWIKRNPIKSTLIAFGIIESLIILTLVGMQLITLY